MCAHEMPDSPVAGGVLADEMGMGKTIQTIALMLQRRNDTQTWRREKLEKRPNTGLKETYSAPTSSMPDPPSEKNAPPSAPRGSTLVVCPVSAMTQWATEITSRTLPGSLSVLLWYGSDRRLATAAHLASYDVVITSYAVLEVEWRRINDRHKVVGWARTAASCAEKKLGSIALVRRILTHARARTHSHLHSHSHSPARAHTHPPPPHIHTHRWRVATAARSCYGAP